MAVVATLRTWNEILGMAKLQRFNAGMDTQPFGRTHGTERAFNPDNQSWMLPGKWKPENVAVKEGEAEKLAGKFILVPREARIC